MTREIETLDVDKNGILDILVATQAGVSILMVDDHLSFSETQLLASDDTIDLICYDFDGDGDTDCVTINMDGVVEFYENYQANGFMEVGTPVRVLNFTNKELDRNLELNYFGARYYQPEFPRFLSPDPVGGTPEVPISWNRYLYCRNDPVNRFDPDGEVAITMTTIGLTTLTVAPWHI